VKTSNLTYIDEDSFELSTDDHVEKNMFTQDSEYGILLSSKMSRLRNIKAITF
jgi:hypothetical protein